jgi:hypothetical protein
MYEGADIGVSRVVAGGQGSTHRRSSLSHGKVDPRLAGAQGDDEHVLIVPEELSPTPSLDPMASARIGALALA